MPQASPAFKEVIGDLKRIMEPTAEYATAAKVYVESFKHVWWVDLVVLRL